MSGGEFQAPRAPLAARSPVPAAMSEPEMEGRRREDPAFTRWTAWGRTTSCPRPGRGERPGQPNGIQTASLGPVTGGRRATTSSHQHQDHDAKTLRTGQRMPTSGTGCRVRKADCRPTAAAPARAE